MFDMVNLMVTEKVQLRQLALVKMQLNKHCLEIVSQLLLESQYLENLDLSWNNFMPKDFAVLFDVLADNKTLRSLNLSCNTIINKADHNNKIDFNFDSAFQDYSNQRKDAIKAGLTEVRSRIVTTKDMPMMAIYSFGRLIRYNNVL